MDYKKLNYTADEINSLLDIVDDNDFVTESEVNAKILAAQLPEGELDLLSMVIDQEFNPESANAQSGVAVQGAIDAFTLIPSFDAWTPNLVDLSTITSGMYSTNASAVEGIVANTSYSHTPRIDVSNYSKIAFKFKDSEWSWTKYNWGYWMSEATGSVSNSNKIAVQGEWTEEGTEIVLDVPAGIKYIGLNFYGSPTAVDTRFYLKGYVGGSGETFVNADKIYPPINTYVRNYYGQEYEGMKWVSFGDSITAQNKWQPTLVDKLGLIHTNCGIGSTCLAGNTDTAFWKDARLDVVKAADPDLVTILGGANDLYAYVPLGTNGEFTKALAEKDTSTFYGAYSYIIENLLTWKPTLKIVILTTTYAHNDGVGKMEGVTYKNFADASREVANHYGLLCADLRNKMGVNALTQSTFTADGIHPNQLGADRIAKIVLATLLEG